MPEASPHRATLAAIVAELIRQDPTGAPGSPHAVTTIEVDLEHGVALLRLEPSFLPDPVHWRFKPALGQPPEVAAEYVGFELAELYLALESGAFEVDERGGRRWINIGGE